jgi:hypothetical protein
MRERGSMSSSKVIFDISEASCFSNSSAMSSILAVLMLQALYQTNPGVFLFFEIKYRHFEIKYGVFCFFLFVFLFICFGDRDISPQSINASPKVSRCFIKIYSIFFRQFFFHFTLLPTSKFNPSSP